MAYKNPPPCIVEGCERLKGSADGLCSTHKWRLRMNGSVDAIQVRTRSACTVSDCGKLAWSSGLCTMNLARFKRNGTTDDPRPSVAARFWAKVDLCGPIPDYAPQLGACWIWTGSSNYEGHGHFFPTRRRLVGAHRWLYELIVGPVDPALHLDHLCRVPRCVRPSHLEPVTPRENAIRGVEARKAAA